jgi:hypothetical protein
MFDEKPRGEDSQANIPLNSFFAESIAPTLLESSKLK